MSNSQIETTTGLCVVALTKYLMDQCDLGQEEAYAKLIQMDLYRLLMDTETNLFLEPNQFLCECCRIELEGGTDALYEYINRE